MKDAEARLKKYAEMDEDYGEQGRKFTFMRRLNYSEHVRREQKDNLALEGNGSANYLRGQEIPGLLRRVMALAKRQFRGD